MGPMYAAATTFCVASYITQSLRGKDDEMNYVIGGFTTGTLTGFIIKRKLLGFWTGVALALIGAAKKHSKLNDYEFYPTYSKVRPQVHGDFRTPYKNWTLYDQRPKGWVAAEARNE